MSDLAQKHCVPCEGSALPLMREESAAFLSRLPAWALSVDGLSISRSVTFPDFKSALHFVNAIGDIAEHEGHHPDIEFGWGRVVVTLFTHAIGGLSENDFIVATKIDAIEK
jgi:4a-hydroxytetrahydrobiopterin dehydratase